MRTLEQLLAALNADAHEDARAIKIYPASQVTPPPLEEPFVAVNPGESEPLAVTEEEKAILLEAGATHDDGQLYPIPSTDG